MKSPKEKPKQRGSAGSAGRGARAAARTAARKKDLAFLQGPTEDGQGARVVRLRDGVLSAGELRPAREGEPLHDREVVRVHPLPVAAPICELEVLYDGHDSAGHESATHESAATARDGDTSGPARVASDSYRRNWSTVFGSGRRKTGDYSVN